MERARARQLIGRAIPSILVSPLPGLPEGTTPESPIGPIPVEPIPNGPIPIGPVPAPPVAAPPVVPDPADPNAGPSPVPSPITVPATFVVVGYCVDVVIGSSSQEYSLLIDTGSSHTWMGARANAKYDPNVPPKPQVGPIAVFQVTYVGGGAKFVDRNAGYRFVNHQPSATTLANQSLGPADAAKTTTGTVYDGILGFGPRSLTEGLVSTHLGPSNTIVDNAFERKLISEKKIAVSFEPTTSRNQENGELTFGGVDTTKYTGALTTVNITSISPASSFVGINATMTYGAGKPITIISGSGITDTGAALILLADDAFQTYAKATGGLKYPKTKLLGITADQYDNLQSLSFNIGGTTFEFTKNAQIWPRSWNRNIGGDSNGIFLIVSSAGSGTTVSSGNNSDFTLGMTWLQRFYTVYDSVKNHFSIANTPFTMAETN